MQTLGFLRPDIHDISQLPGADPEALSEPEQVWSSIHASQLPLHKSYFLYMIIINVQTTGSQSEDLQLFASI